MLLPKLPDSSSLQVNRVIVRDDSSEPFQLDNITLTEDMLLVKVDLGLDLVFAINVESTPKLPISLRYNALRIAIDSQRLHVIDMAWDPKVLRAFEQLSPAEQHKAQSRYDVIAPLISDLEAVIRNSHGEGVFKKVITESGHSKQYVYDCFNAFLFYGQRRAALALPMGKNIFRLPKEKREIRVKQGRPNQITPKGKVLDEYDYHVFETGKRLYRTRNGLSIKAVYERLMQKHYFASRVRNSIQQERKTNERFKVTLKPITERPTLSQFAYWLNNEFGGNLPARDRKRKNPIEFNKDLAGRVGDAFLNDDGFGKVFELDETPFDEELVSEFDITRRTKIGKATLYFVIDRFSRYIVGIYITTEAPSYNTVRQALFNAATNKDRFLEQYGFAPGEITWDFFGVCTTLFVDNAEFRNRKSESAVSDLNIDVQFARRGRGDDKPHVEQLFRTFSLFFKGLSKAHQTKSRADIAAQLARKNAAITLTELYIIAIVYINFYNNHRRIKDYPFAREMLQDSVEPVPAKLCQWGSKYRPGHIIKYEEDELYLKLLPGKQVSVHQKGIYFPGTGLWYNSEFTFESGLQHRGDSRNAVIYFQARFNPNFIDIIFLETEQGLKPATLDMHRSGAFSGLSFYEVELQQKALKAHEENSAQELLEYRLGVQLVIEKLVKAANKERTPGTLPQLAKINENRKAEAIINRYSDIERYLEAVRAGIEPKDQPDQSEHNDSNRSIYDDFYGDDDE